MFTDSTPKQLILMEYAGPFSRLVVLFSIFAVAFALLGVLSGALGEAGALTRGPLLLISALQNIFCFAMPTLILGFLVSARPMKWCGLSERPGGVPLFAMLVIFFAAMPALNQVIYWNEHISFGSAEIDAMLRELEESAQAMTSKMLHADSLGGVAINILIIGCLTGLCEELFFRGGLQKILAERLNIHVAVWVSAIIFSAMHFQFFGFIPRILLGAFFGYLYAANGSIWLNATAHALNNSIVVISVWIADRYDLTVEPEMWGTQPEGLPIPALISTAFVIILIYCCRRKRLLTKDKNG